MKIILFGSTGLLGSYLFQALKKEAHFQLISPSHQSLDLLDFEAMGDFIKNHHPDWIINSVAYTQVDQAEIQRERCFDINVRALENIISLGYPIIHFSTDYVFGGQTRNQFPQGIPEDTLPTPLNYYGETKAQAERLLESSKSPWINIRTSGLFGKGRTNFVEKIIEQSDLNESIKVVEDQIMRPTFCKDLAESVVENFIKASKVSGHYHLQNEGDFISWADFARAILEPFHKSSLIENIPSSSCHSMAKRPFFTGLKNTKTQPLRDWKSALHDYLNSK